MHQELSISRGAFELRLLHGREQRLLPLKGKSPEISLAKELEAVSTIWKDRAPAPCAEGVSAAGFRRREFLRLSTEGTTIADAVNVLSSSGDVITDNVTPRQPRHFRPLLDFVPKDFP